MENEKSILDKRPADGWRVTPYVYRDEDGHETPYWVAQRLSLAFGPVEIRGEILTWEAACRYTWEQWALITLGQVGKLFWNRSGPVTAVGWKRDGEDGIEGCLLLSVEGAGWELEVHRGPRVQKIGHIEREDPVEVLVITALEMTESLIRRKPAPEWRIMYRPKEGLYKMEGPRRTALMPPRSDASDTCRRTWEIWALETLGPLAEGGWAVTEGDSQG